MGNQIPKEQIIQLPKGIKRQIQKIICLRTRNVIAIVFGIKQHCDIKIRFIPMNDCSNPIVTTRSLTNICSYIGEIPE